MNIRPVEQATSSNRVTLTLKGIRITVSLEEVTREISEQWMARNIRNRKLKKATARRLAAALARSEWKFTGETIKFDRHGNLLDGQHRLEACIESGVSFVALVVWDLDPDVFVILDSGDSRKPADVLHIDGNEEAGVKAAITRWHRFYVENKTLNVEGSKHPSRQQIIDYYHGHKEAMDWAVTNGCSIWKRPPRLLSKAEWCFLFLVFGELDREDAYLFLQALSEGTGLKEDDPIYQLRQKLIENVSSRHRKMEMSSKMALCIKAWNLYRRGKTVKNLVWRAVGPAGESFPTAE